ncbi:MAG TPA: hypothetical protein VGO11_13745 [Chthoniobacteraceae bacterium]|jgi:hypothetical protein|nr:hypothetical protein [Chthoniobacteraceae bacterium]
MSEPVRIVFNPAKLAKHFSALQPVGSPVHSADAVVSPCCLLTTLRLEAGGKSERTYSLELPLQSHHPNETPDVPPLNVRQHVMTAKLPPPMIQLLASGAEAELLLQASGPSECPPGRANLVHVAGPAGEPLTRAVPFEGWAIPLVSPFDLEEAGDFSAEVLARIHPCAAPELAPAVCRVSVPGCSAVPLQATVAVFPDLQWEGGLTVSAVPDGATQKGFRLELESDVTCRSGAARWKPTTWTEAVALCPWLECVEMLARSVAAFAPLRPAARAEGLDNPRLGRRGLLTWTWPKCRWRIESALRERPENGLLAHRLRYEVAGEPLLAATGEVSLLGAWLENPLWWERLAPLRVGLRGTHISELMQELGLWLVAEGRLTLQMRREEERPVSPSQVRASARGRLAVEIEGRSARDYEAVLVRAGGAEATEEAGFTIACEAPPASALPEVAPEPCLARVAFGGLVLRSLEKLRPGIRVRSLAGAGAPLASLLLPRVWPAAAATEPVAVPWSVP